MALSVTSHVDAGEANHVAGTVQPAAGTVPPGAGPAAHSGPLLSPLVRRSGSLHPSSPSFPVRSSLTKIATLASHRLTLALHADGGEDETRNGATPGALDRGGGGKWFSPVAESLSGDSPSEESSAGERAASSAESLSSPLPQPRGGDRRHVRESGDKWTDTASSPGDAVVGIGGPMPSSPSSRRSGMVVTDEGCDAVAPSPCAAVFRSRAAPWRGRPAGFRAKLNFGGLGPAHRHDAQLPAGFHLGSVCSSSDSVGSRSQSGATRVDRRGLDDADRGCSESLSCGSESPIANPSAQQVKFGQRRLWNIRPPPRRDIGGRRPYAPVVVGTDAEADSAAEARYGQLWNSTSTAKLSTPPLVSSTPQPPPPAPLSPLLVWIRKELVDERSFSAADCIPTTHRDNLLVPICQIRLAEGVWGGPARPSREELVLRVSMADVGRGRGRWRQNSNGKGAQWQQAPPVPFSYNQQQPAFGSFPPFGYNPQWPLFAGKVPPGFQGPFPGQWLPPPGPPPGFWQPQGPMPVQQPPPAQQPVVQQQQQQVQTQHQPVQQQPPAQQSKSSKNQKLKQKQKDGAAVGAHHADVPPPMSSSTPIPAVSARRGKEKVDGYASIICYNCGDPGHHKQACTQPIICFICGLAGHEVEVCPTKNQPCPISAFYGSAAAGLVFFSY